MDQCPRRQAASRGALVPAPAPAAKKVKKTTSKGSKPDMVHRQSSRLFGAKTSPAKRLAATGVDSSSSDSSSSHSSSSSKPPASQQGSKLPGSSVPPTLKRSRGPLPPMEFELSSMLIDEE